MATDITGLDATLLKTEQQMHEREEAELWEGPVSGLETWGPLQVGGEGVEPITPPAKQNKTRKLCLLPLRSVDSHLQQPSGPPAPGPALAVVVVAAAVSRLLPVGAVRVGSETPVAEVDGGWWCWCWGVWLTAAPVLEKLAVL